MTGDRFKDGYASAERHWKARWHQANGELQLALSAIERVRELHRAARGLNAGFCKSCDSTHPCATITALEDK